MDHGHHHGPSGVYYQVRKPRISWADVGGYGSVKEILKEMVSLPLKDTEMIKRMNIEPPAGVLMWGPLGTGIKMLAEASAAEAGANYICVSGQEMLGKGGELKKAFADAEKNAPAVLFISDVEWLAPRAGTDYEWENGNLRGIPSTFADKELTTAFIQAIDALQCDAGESAVSKRVMMVGSCYRIDVVDQAIIKEKRRFNRKVFVPPPAAEDRLEILKIYVTRLGDNVEAGVDLKTVADRAEGFVGWDLENLCKRAALDAVKDGGRKIGQEHFLEALSEIEPWLTPGMIEKYYRLRELDCSHYYTF